MVLPALAARRDLAAAGAGPAVGPRDLAVRPRSSAVLTTNAGHSRVLHDRFGRTAVQVPLAPNVPDLGPSDPRRDAPPARRARRRGVVAFFGFVHPVKGLRYLIEALARLRGGDRSGHDASTPHSVQGSRHTGSAPHRLHLLILGGFTSLALPEHEAGIPRGADGLDATCGVARHVTITGHLPAAEVSAALHAADVAAFPFTAGATTKSGALLSAFAHGCPPSSPRRTRPIPTWSTARPSWSPPRPRRARAGRRPGPAARRRAATS